MNKKPYFNPYIGGILLGLTLVATYIVTGRGLGASGASKSLVVSTLNIVAPSHVQSNPFFQHYVVDHDGIPIKEWLIFLIAGSLIGGFVSGTLANRIKFKIDKGPKISNKTRLIFALIGGMFFGYGAQFSRGCTSGAALTPMAVFASSGFLTMMAIFGSGFAIAYFFRKLWL